MADNYITKKEDFGSINISEDVISTIVRSCISEVEGAAGVSSSIGADFAEKIGWKNFNTGVRIKMNDSGIVVDIVMHVNYGYNIVEVAGKVQENVRSTLQSMTGIDDIQVNVHVAGISF